MTIPYSVSVGNRLTDRQKKEIDQVIQTTFEETNAYFNKYNPHSELSLLNQLPGGKKIPISHEMETFLQMVDHLVQLTDAYFDPTVEPIQRIWKEHLENNQLPNNSVLAEVQPTVGWHNIHFENGSFYKDHDATAMDFGGIAKGYCVDQITHRLKNCGFENVVVEWGGEVFCQGNHPSGRLWTIGVPNLQEKTVSRVPLKNQALATSGNYFQSWTVGGVTYTHIIDPKKLVPIISNEFLSGSVIAPSCTTADALATALLLFENEQKAEEWMNKVKEGLINEATTDFSEIFFLRK